jgi:hypothetical protein
MIRREYKSLKLFVVIVIAILSTWQGKRNLTWFLSQVSGQECSATWLLIQCK